MTILQTGINITEGPSLPYCTISAFGGEEHDFENFYRLWNITKRIDLNHETCAPLKTTNNPLHFGIIQHFSSFRSSVPDFCKLPADKGNCRGFFPSFYFDANEGVCYSFVYGGCNGNQNKFDDAKTCMDVCNPSNPNNFCKLPADPGPCRAHHGRFYFDANEGVCKEFVYGGCFGNQNRFDNARKCKKACKSFLTG